MIEKAGLATVEEIDPDTVHERFRAELAAADAVLHSPELLAAWSVVS